jgi:hypothetical protein
LLCSFKESKLPSVGYTASLVTRGNRSKQIVSSRALAHRFQPQMTKEMSTFAEASPIESHIGSLDEALSFLSIYQNASNQVARSSQKYQQEVIDYCIEWEAVVTTRIDKEMADVKKLRETYNHYQGKVDGIRKKVNVQEAKGKSVNDGVADKLKRNEQKLDEASSEFEAAAGPLCFLLEEVVYQGWKDLYPLVQATMKWEADRSQNEARVFQQLQPGTLEAAFPTGIGASKSASIKKKPTPPGSPIRKSIPQPTPPKRKPTPPPAKTLTPTTQKNEDEDDDSMCSVSSTSTEPPERKVDAV